MQSETMPSELNLSPPPTIPQARTYISKQMSEYTEYDVNKGTKIRVDIPRLQRSYLMKDSYIRFRLNMDLDAHGADDHFLCFDRCGAFGLIDRIEVYDYLGGTLIEQTNNVPGLMTLLLDTDSNIISNSGKLFSNSGLVPPSTYPAEPDSNSAYIRDSVTGKLLSDLSYNKDRFQTIEFTLPVMSFLGTLSDKYVPLHNGFSVYFHLNSVDNAFITRYRDQNHVIYNPLVNCWISNFEYVCQIIELGEQAESIVQSSQPLVISSKQYRNFSDQILGDGMQSNFRFDLNLNVVSLRNIFFTMRPNLFQNNISFPTYGHRIRNYLENWNFQYGSSYLPEIAGISARSSTVPQSRDSSRFEWLSTADASIPVTGFCYSEDYCKALGYTQCLEELSKCFNDKNLTRLDQMSYMIDTLYANNKNPYNGNISAGPFPFQFGTDTSNASDVIGKFAAGLNCRLSNKSTVSGIDTNGLQVSVNGKFDNNNIHNMVDAILDVWCEHDSFVQIIPGIATTVTF